MQEYTRRIAEHIANTQYDDLPEEAKLFAKKSIMDTLGIMFPATTLAQTSGVVHDLILDIDEGQSCSLIGYGEKASLLSAAFMNGSLTHAVDFDDSAGTYRPLVHPSGSCFPAAITLGEFVDATGKDLIAAMAVANDIGIRLADCVKGNILWDYDFFPITTIGVFEATIAAAKLLKLDTEQTIDALGLAVNRVSGLRDTLFNCEFRSIRDAFANQEGIRCAYLAQRGFEGCKTPIEDLFRLIYKDNVDMASLTDKLGVEYTGATLVTYKLWPSCQGTQAYAEAALQILESNPDLDISEIKSISLSGAKESYDMFYPKRIKAHPKTSITSKISIPYVVANMILKKDLKLADFEVDALDNPAVDKLTDLMEFEIDDSHNANSASASITMNDGTEYKVRAEYVRGAVCAPVTLEQLISKFKGNVKLARRPVPEGNMETISDLLINFENVQSIRDFMALLS